MSFINKIKPQDSEKKQKKEDIRKNTFPCLFSIHNAISLLRHEQVCLIRLRLERCFSYHQAT